MVKESGVRLMLVLGLEVCVFGDHGPGLNSLGLEFFGTGFSFGDYYIIVLDSQLKKGS